MTPEKNFVYTIKYTVSVPQSAINEVLDKARETGEAEIINVTIKTVEGKGK